MANLVWTTATLSDGVSHGAVYASDGTVHSWCGITTVADTSSPTSGAQYLDGQVQTISKPDGEYTSTVSAYTYPEVLDDHYRFVGLTYRTSSTIHLVYNPLVLSTGTQSWDTDASEQSPVDFEFTVSALAMSGSSTSHVVVDLDAAIPSAVSELEAFLYGTDSTEPSWPSIEWIVETFEAQAILRIIDNRDGTWTAIGPESAIKMVSATEFEITWPSARFVDVDTYRISSL